MEVPGREDAMAFEPERQSGFVRRSSVLSAKLEFEALQHVDSVPLSWLEEAGHRRLADTVDRLAADFEWINDLALPCSGSRALTGSTSSANWPSTAWLSLAVGCSPARSTRSAKHKGLCGIPAPPSWSPTPAFGSDRGVCVGLPLCSDAAEPFRESHRDPAIALRLCVLEPRLRPSTEIVGR